MPLVVIADGPSSQGWCCCLPSSPQTSNGTFCGGLCVTKHALQMTPTWMPIIFCLKMGFGMHIWQLGRRTSRKHSFSHVLYESVHPFQQRLAQESWSTTFLSLRITTSRYLHRKRIPRRHRQQHNPVHPPSSSLSSVGQISGGPTTGDVSNMTFPRAGAWWILV